MMIINLRSKTLFLSICLFGMGFSSASFAFKDCHRATDPVSCVIINRDDLNRSYWDILNAFRDEALDCRGSSPSRFLKLASVSPIGTELYEFIDEGIERLCIERPTCARKALASLNDADRAAVNRLLSTPLLHEPGALAVCQ